jgi:RNA ligase (TIGR02306 family)
MAEFKVIKTNIEILPHPKADRLEILKIGGYQVVVKKGDYLGNEAIIFAPEKSILPPEIAINYQQYLKGSDKNRVGAIRLRGELSQGVIIPLKDVDPDDLLPYNVDIAEKLGIYKYEPPVPQNLTGKLLETIDFPVLTHHDVEQFRIYVKEFVEGEPVRVFEKIHGSQGVYLRNPQGEIAVSSKGLMKKYFTIEESTENLYWQSAKNMDIFNIIGQLYPNSYVQLFGEVIPVQNGFTYGYEKLTSLFFKLVVDGTTISYDRVPEILKKHWVPLLYEGKFDLEAIVSLCENIKYETVSKQQLHISEGGVLVPFQPRISRERFDLQLKIISKAYAKIEDDDAIS